MKVLGVEFLLTAMLFVPSVMFAAVAAQFAKLAPRPVSSAHEIQFPRRRASDQQQMELFKESAA